jgi:hypothetical protein
VLGDLALGGLAFHDLAQGLVDPRLPAAPRRFEIVDHLGADAQRYQLLGRRFARAASPADRCDEIGEDFAERPRLGEVRLRQLRIVTDRAKILCAVSGLFFLALFIKFPFFAAGGPACRPVRRRSE